MATIKVEIRGMKEIQDDLNRLGTEAAPRVKFGLTKFLSIVADAARLKCPVKTGQLQSSITHQITREDDKVVEGRVGSNVKYAPYVEFGTGIYGPNKQVITPKNKKVLAWVAYGPRPTTAEGWKRAQREGRAIFARRIRGMRPRPYLQPAMEENINKLVDCLKETLK